MQKMYVLCYSKDKNVVAKSSSGGAFYEISEFILDDNNKSKIYGCILDEQLKAIHVGTENKEIRNKMMGSKYIKSEIKNIYKEVEQDLQEGLNVLFSGTPCQIAALHNYLEIKNIKTEKLYTLDFICHGVGNNNFFKDYIDYLEKKYKSKAISCNFRRKKTKGKLQDIEIIFENGKKYYSSSCTTDWFYSVYSKNLIINKNCFACKYANEKRISDITLSDAWGNSIDGCDSPSIIIINSEKGKILFEKIKDKFIYKIIEQKNIRNPQLYSASTKPQIYDEFNKIYEEKGYLAAQKYIGNNTIKGFLKSLAADIIYISGIYKIIKYVKNIIKH